MKNILNALLLILLIPTVNSCKKGTTSSISTNLMVGHWYIHHIYLRTYQNNIFLRDTTLPNLPQPNYIDFNSNGTVEYRYNATTSETGTYQLKSPDSVYATIGGTTFRWRIDLLITTNFNVVSTTYNYPSPGRTVETYQSFVK